VKFLVDMPLPPALAQWLQAQGHDAVHAVALGLERAADSAIMERATAEGWTIVTADLDYPRLLALAEAIGPSLILFRGGDWSEAAAIDRMAQVLDSLTEQDIAQSVLVIDRHRVRRRRLPISRGRTVE
jgi:predicted nuclease of predicted toxin-antitoxin system